MFMAATGEGGPNIELWVGDREAAIEELRRVLSSFEALSIPYQVGAFYVAQLLDSLRGRPSVEERSLKGAHIVD